MPTSGELLTRLRDAEDSLIERKGNWNDREEIREAVVAFANSLYEPDTGVLFLGVSPDGTLSGAVQDADKVQIEVRKYLKKCYPPLEAAYQTFALDEGGKKAVAVVVSASRDRPHFTGLCAIRMGSETIKTVAATEQRYQEMIEERSDIVWALKPWVGKQVTVVCEKSDAYGHSWSHPVRDWTLFALNSHFVTVAGRGTHGETYALRRIVLEHDTGMRQPLLRVALRP